MLTYDKGVHTVDAPAADPSQESAPKVAAVPDRWRRPNPVASKATHLPCNRCHVRMRPVVRPGSSPRWDWCYECVRRAVTRG
ncbi:hypothetical protein Cme02nite_69270 [Catellatospora methionotrophica]|uniref:Uncharacterized protein n=1 Tax=Catellatospora methionotrophica TaxID=121620 RepID=A0A8J3LPX2_9ACTN|nr:hypothetical protein Cme02nite_69270 [Catellatospora methionotrophica]